MCGIFAAFSLSGRPLEIDECRRATALIRHRGPDGDGEWFDAAHQVYLGHRRLSILDLSDAARQPMCAGGGQVLTFNGEIYNFRELRKELEAGGARFRSSGDTEVLLRALEAWGEPALHRLLGMFAFVLWSPARGEAFVARDFLGIKPLYVWESRDTVAFASESKCFRAFAAFQPRLRRSALPEFLRFRNLCGGETLLEGVSRVLPGQCITIRPRTGAIARRRYWRCEDELGRGGGDFLARFRVSVRAHLVSDVPVGTQLSGGVDSTLVSAAARKDCGADLTGFHCIVRGAEYDETPYTRRAAGHLGIPLETVELDGERFLSEELDKLTWHMDEPLGHPNAMGVHFVSRAAFGKVKVLLSGEAADEIFAGYPRYSRLLLSSRLRASALQRGAARLAWPASGRYRAALREAKLPSDEAIVASAAFLSAGAAARLLCEEAAPEASVAARRALLPGADFDLLTRLQIYEIQTYLPPLLVRQDKMSMAASIENRVPFATPEMVRLALGLPASLRADTRRQKVVLKRALREYFPPELIMPRKVGFGLPLARWLARPAGRERVHALAAPGSPLEGVLDMRAVRTVVASGDAEPLWILLSLAVWLKTQAR